MAVSEKLFEFSRKQPRMVLADSIGELYIDVGTYNTLKAANIDTVTSVRALVEEHGSLRSMVPGIGAIRDAEVKKALEHYDESTLPLEAPDVRAAGVAVACARAYVDLARAALLAEDPALAGDVSWFNEEVLKPRVLAGALTPGSHTYREGWSALNGVKV